MLNSLKIKRFRALEDFVVPKLGRVNLIVGKNNSGKSTVLEALQIYANNGDPRLLETLAESHGEPSRPDWETMPQTIYDLPFASFFTGRAFPEGDEGIEIGEVDSNQCLIIEHGYYVEWDESLIDEAGEVFSRQRLKRIPKSEVEKADESPLIDALFIKKGERLLGFRIDEVIRQPRWRGVSNSPYDLPCVVIPTRFISINDLANEWDKITLTEKQETVKEALRLIDSKFVDISFVRDEREGSRRYPERSLTRTAKVKLEGQPMPVPLGSMGDGMLRVLQIVLKVFSAQGGLLLIDEFENGLHYSVQERVWGLIFELAEQLDIQVFATTHSWDCIESFINTAIEYQNSEGVLFRMGRSARISDRGRVIATVFDEEQIQNITQTDVEVR
ncbi:hypothetical protein BXU06_15675 [Aquaspirillum sp. LM1]|uniref:AAA family ATPase n=1 Tax=Aquaspirillum sp. LM1 TaxID=1938604 RepID=UPI000983A5C5|nr:ATP-binding protein [Aquaspirillum sp. LM1]AQR66321.1 hypothetical protein BXU06_15675 [Aquaspirillum sp. LM1]